MKHRYTDKDAMPWFVRPSEKTAIERQFPMPELCITQPIMVIDPGVTIVPTPEHPMVGQPIVIDLTEGRRIIGYITAVKGAEITVELDERKAPRQLGGYSVDGAVL